MNNILMKLNPVYKDSFVIVVSNPVDYLTGYLAENSVVPKEKICGTGCVLDGARWVKELAEYFNVEKRDIVLHVIGTHGTDPKVLWEKAGICGQSAEEYSKKYCKALMQK